MATPTLIDADSFGGTSESMLDSRATKTFTLQAGDFLVTELHVYQSDSNAAPIVVSDSLNGTWTEYARAVSWVGGGSDRTFAAVHAVLASGAGSTTVTINPPGSEALIWGSVQQFRGGTFAFADDAIFEDPDGGASTSSPIVAGVTGLASGDYLIAGTFHFDFNEGDLNSFTPGGSPQVNHHAVAGPYWQSVFSTRAYESVSDASLTWSFSVGAAESIFISAWAAAAFRFSAGGGEFQPAWARGSNVLLGMT